MWDGEVDRVEQEVLQAGLELDKAPLPHSKEKKKKCKSRGKRVAQQIRNFKESNDPKERDKLALLRWDRNPEGGKAEKKRKKNRTQQLAETELLQQAQEKRSEPTEAKPELLQQYLRFYKLKTESNTEVETEPKTEPTETKNESTEDAKSEPSDSQAEQDAKSESADSTTFPGSPVSEVASGSAALPGPSALPVSWAPGIDTDTSSDEGLTWTRRAKASYELDP